MTDTAPHTAETKKKTKKEEKSFVRFCSETLDNAEKQIKVLTRSENGDIAERDFTTE